MALGTVKWFDMRKGYGIIEPEDGSEEVRVHRDEVEGLSYDEPLRVGEEVEFEVEQSPMGLSAIEVRRLDF